MGIKRVVIAGCGFLGEAAAVSFHGAGWKVLGLCATEASAARFSGRPFEVLARDISSHLPAVDPEWLAPDVLIHCASSGRGGAEAYRAVYRDGMENLIQAFNPVRVIFTGSTSVYAQTGGEWVDEDSAAVPVRETGSILLEAEQVALRRGGVVARLSGIFGPGRSVLLRKFLDGTAVLESGGLRWINQIHRDDAASALVRLADPAVPAGVFNVCDDTPATQRDVYGWIAAALGKPLPPSGEPDFNRKRGWTSKRVRNTKLRRTGWAPVFPSYAEALPGLISAAG